MQNTEASKVEIMKMLEEAKENVTGVKGGLFFSPGEDSDEEEVNAIMQAVIAKAGKTPEDEEDEEDEKDAETFVDVVVMPGKRVTDEKAFRFATLAAMNNKSVSEVEERLLYMMLHGYNPNIPVEDSANMTKGKGAVGLPLFFCCLNAKFGNVLIALLRIQEPTVYMLPTCVHMNTSAEVQTLDMLSSAINSSYGKSPEFVSLVSAYKLRAEAWATANQMIGETDSVPQQVDEKLLWQDVSYISCTIRRFFSETHKSH